MFFKHPIIPMAPVMYHGRWQIPPRKEKTAPFPAEQGPVVLANSREWSFPSDVCEGEVSDWISWGIVATLFLTSPLSIQTIYASLLPEFLWTSTPSQPRNKKHPRRPEGFIGKLDPQTRNGHTALGEDPGIPTAFLMVKKSHRWYEILWGMHTIPTKNKF